MPGSYPPAMQKLVDQFTNADLGDQQVVQVGAFQPHEVVRVHHNPGELVLTNAFQGDVANNTVVLLTDGVTRTGLKFTPDTSALSRPGQHLSLIVASTINQTISIELEGYPAKEVTVVANVPSITNIGSLFGIPLLASTASFFDVATGDGGSASGLINADSLEGNLVYSGGTIAFGGELGTQAAFAYSHALPLGAALQVTWPVFTVSGQQPYEQIFLLLSEHESPVTALQNRSSSTMLLATDKTQAGNNNGLFVEKYLLGALTPELEHPNKPETRIKATLTAPGGHPELDEGGVLLLIEDLDADTSETYPVYLPEATSKPMFCHLIVLVDAAEASAILPAYPAMAYSFIPASEY